ncbi:hypothetical protein MKW98_020180 [Papaver atlanticum]|uniref:Glutamate receptor n=1 Tax=Papaver atlanticum TaxID=357466 RepID=A0AAD4S985_9MAGN|nr:hypothetical protein MKW98_020180 [Papaver atlanticum]
MKELSHNCHQLNVITNHLLLFLFAIHLLGNHELVVMGQNTSQVVEEFKVGVILDLNISVAKVWLTSMNMALSDFYATTSHKRRLVFHVRDSNRDVLDASSAAIDLIKNVEVQAIIGPMASAQAIHMVPLGSRSQVPIISFSATSTSISLSQNPYFIRTTLEDSAQVNAIAAVVKAFGWRTVVPLYEDTEYGHGIIPYLVDALQSVNTRVPYRSVFPVSASDDRIVQELHNFKIMQTRVFILHMVSPLGLRIFEKAKKIGMMSKGYSWIVTEGLGSDLSSFNSSAIDTMQGVVAIRPYIPMSKELSSFEVQWKRKFQKENPDIDWNLDILGIWAYDTGWALASAVEKLESTSPRFSKQKTTLNTSDVTRLGVSQIGPELLQGISNINFKGLSGEFHVVDRKLQSEIFQILNVVGRGAREIGIWTPSDGIIRDISLVEATKSTYLTSNKENLRPIIWPGDTTDIPKGWVVSTNEYKLRIAVPVKEGFNEFVKVENNSGRYSGYEVTGYCIDVFKAALDELPYDVPYDLIPFQDSKGKAGSYDDLVYQVNAQQGYMDIPQAIGVEALVTTGAFFFIIGAVIWILEHRVNREFRGGPHPLYQWGTMLSFSFSMLVFAQKERVLSSLGRFVIAIWLFVVLIITQSYTANLTSMLTIQRSDPTYTDVNELKDGRYNVGYQEGSFVFGMLKGMGFHESNLIIFKSPKDIDNAFSKGTIVAAFEELPYIELLLAEYCNKYMMVSPKGSPLGPDISRKILSIREEGKTKNLKRASFKTQRSCSDRDPFFWVLFLITGLCAAFAVIVFLCENKQIPNEPNSTTREKIINLLRKFYEYDENRMITYFECNPACSERNKAAVNGDQHAAETVDFGDSPARVENSPSIMGYGDVTPQNGNFNTARRNSTTFGYFTPTSEGDSTEFGNSTPGDTDSAVSGVRNSTLHILMTQQGHRDFEEH